VDTRRYAPATERNRAPILAVLEEVVPTLPAPARVLEIASGSGEHAVFFAEALGVAWQPSDPDPPSRASIDAWRAHANAARVAPAIDLDVTRPWPSSPVSMVVAINMLHISPWEAGLALFAGAADLLPERGVLFLYGPFKRNGAHTAPTNEAFDSSLRARDPRWGVRDLDDVTAAAAAHGLVLERVVPMPANNSSVILRATLRP
jgi:Protein of unknown function (DUF938)